MYARLQALLMVASVAVPITQHNVIVLHPSQCALNTTACHNVPLVSMVSLSCAHHNCAVNTTACHMFDSMLGSSMPSEAVCSA